MSSRASVFPGHLASGSTALGAGLWALEGSPTGRGLGFQPVSEQTLSNERARSAKSARGLIGRGGGSPADPGSEVWNLMHSGGEAFSLLIGFPANPWDCASVVAFPPLPSTGIVASAAGSKR